jgi:hypothetical protein
MGSLGGLRDGRATCIVPGRILNGYRDYVRGEDFRGLYGGSYAHGWKVARRDSWDGQTRTADDAVKDAIKSHFGRKEPTQ